MHISKTKFSAAFIVFLMFASFALIANVSVAPVGAQVSPTQPYSGPIKAGDVANYTIWSIPYLSVTPNVAGSGQMILINMWMTVAPHNNRKLLDFKLTITKPDNTTEVYTMDSEPATGATWLNYVPNQAGDWKFQFDFPGTFFPAGRYLNGVIVTNSSGTNFADSHYFPPASTPVTTITVQNEIVYSWPPSALPTDYWTRPVAFEHREWWPILGNYPWNGPGGGATWDALYPNTNPYWSAQQRFTPYTLAPNTPHVVWKRQQYISAGIVGASLEGPSLAPTEEVAGGFITFYDAFASPTYGFYNNPSVPSICYQGYAYQTLTKVMPILINGTYYNQPTSVWQCYDIQTGEVRWEITGVSAPNYIEYSISSPGTPNPATNMIDANLLSISGSRLIKYNPDTGAVVANVSVPVTGTYYRNGFCLAVQNLGTSVPVDQRYRLINWTTFGTTSNWNNRLVSNTSYAMSNLPSYIDWQAGLGATVSTVSSSGVYIGCNITGYDLYTGATLWSIVIPETPFNSTPLADHGKVAFQCEQGYFLAFDLRTGKQAWKSPMDSYPWDRPGFGYYGIASAYGLIFRNGYGAVYAVDWDTGEFAWVHATPAPNFETPYTGPEGEPVYSHNQFGFPVDGKYYVWTNEHSPSQPITRGWGLECINITTGERIWYKMGGSSGTVVAHDGYLFLPNTATGYLEIIGKGKSAATVTASPKISSHGSKVMIEGTVLDQSPAQPGTPCVSKESMSLQMEYLHNQMPIGGIWNNETITGVPVSLDTVDPNGNYVHIADVTTDGYSGTFGYAWTPEIEGDYTVTATFMGDDSYGSSFATTYVNVGPAPEPYPEPVEPEPQKDYMPMLYGIMGAVIAAIVIGLVAVLLVLRKR